MPGGLPRALQHSSGVAELVLQSFVCPQSHPFLLALLVPGMGLGEWEKGVSYRYAPLSPGAPQLLPHASRAGPSPVSFLLAP